MNKVALAVVAALFTVLLAARAVVQAFHRVPQTPLHFYRHRVVRQQIAIGILQA